ncbi:CXorf49B isoform 2 [Pan troglodytes]|uniref:CXorf49B isoform 2 n=1 Tax=Pan troglodytes TaxID=9598 RepID=A0A2J8IL76_PANTR|nr:CXorf49B isoform 2 [Pan troglodytes]
MRRLGAGVKGARKPLAVWTSGRPSPHSPGCPDWRHELPRQGVRLWGQFRPGGWQKGWLPQASPGAPGAHSHGLDLGCRAARWRERERFTDPGGFSFESESELIEQGRVVLWGREGRPGTPVDDQGTLWTTHSTWLTNQPPSCRRPASRDTRSQKVPLPKGRLRIGQMRRSVPVGETCWATALENGSRPLPAVSTSAVLGQCGPGRTRKGARRADGASAWIPSSPLRKAPPGSPRSEQTHPDRQAPLQGELPACAGPFPDLCSPRTHSSRREAGCGRAGGLSPEENAEQGLGKGGGQAQLLRSCRCRGPAPGPFEEEDGRGEEVPRGCLSTGPGRGFPACGERLSAAPPEPAPFPPFSGVRPQGMSKKPQKPKHSSPGKKPAGRKTRESQAAAREDNDPNRDEVPRAQLPTHRPGLPRLSVRRGEFSSSDPNIRAPQLPGTSEPSAYSPGGLVPRRHAPSGNQQPPVHPPRPERQQQPPGAQGCLRCIWLQREIEDLTQQLAAMQFLTDKFQDL